MHPLYAFLPLFLGSTVALAQSNTAASPAASTRSYALATTPIENSGAPVVSCTTLTGRILDHNQQGLVGATVAIKGTYEVFTTNAEGTYVVNVPVTGAQVLLISAGGYSEKQIRLLNCNNLTLSLEPLPGTRIKQRGKLKGTIKKVGR